MRKITTINSIEISSLCNNKCPYCPSPIQGEHRKVGLMDVEVFKIAIGWVRHFVKHGTQKELNLFGVGESTLHTELVSMVEYAKLKLPVALPIHLNTNGKLMTQELAVGLKRAGISHIDITGHDAYITARTIKIFKDVGIEGQLSFDFITQPNNWAGLVDWFEPDYSYPCQWLRDGQVMIMSSGDVTTCCIDAFGEGIFTHVGKDITQAYSQPHKLCDGCHHEVPEDMKNIKMVA